MKQSYCFLFAATITLSACGDVNAYRPQVSVSPPNSTYEKDVTQCITEGKERHKQAVDSYVSSGNFLWAGTLGLAGSAVGSKIGSDDYNKSTYDFINECLEAKGYKLVR